VDLTSIVELIQASALSEWMRGSLKALPIIEAIHVMAIAVVFGTIFIVDLRLLGVPNAQRAFTRVADELLRWTWGAFIVAAITGALLFAVNATTYFVNTPFRWKMFALLCAGVNMAVFHLTTFRRVAAWDKNAPTPLAGRVAGAASIVIWVSVILLGRWIGFTKGYNFEIPDDVDLNFDFLE
jgi:hypothetical protein